MSRALPLLFVCLLACGRAAGGDPMRVVPTDVRAAVIAPSLALLQARVSSFLAGVEGSSGVLDLLADRFALDLRTPEGPGALGLDADKALALFVHGDERVLVGAASVADRDRFLEGARARLEKGAGARLATAGDTLPEGRAWLFHGPGTPPRWHAALGVTTDGVGLLVLAAQAADAPPLDVLARFDTFSGGRLETSFATSDTAMRARATAGPDAALLLVVDELLPPAPRSLGLARGIVQAQLDALPVFVGGLALPLGERGVESLALRLSAARVGEGALPVAWFTPPGSPEPLARAFPKTTTAFVRARVALDKVRALPGFVRDSVLPDRLPGLETAPLPALSDLIDMIEGDVAVALLGLDAGANLAHLAYAVGDTRRLLSVFHVALAARHRDLGLVTRTFSGIASQLETSGWAVAPIAQPAAEIAGRGGAWRGWSLARDGKHYAVLIDDELIVFILGAGEVDDFLAVKAGRALSLASFAEGASGPIADALGLGPRTATPGADTPSATPFGLTASPLRLTRELSARGLPPYFLKIINDVRLLATSVDLGADRLEIALEIAL